MQPEAVASIVAATVVFLLVFWLFDRATSSPSTTFIAWGILVAILSVAYSVTSVPSVMLVAPTLAKIGFLLVLGGLARSLISSQGLSSESKKGGHV